MNHPTADELLLFVYDELPEDQAVQIESHIDACGACQHKLAQLERGRAALDLALPLRRRHAAIVWTTVALAAAAVIAGLLITRFAPVPDPVKLWAPTTTWSASWNPAADSSAKGRATGRCDVTRRTAGAW